MSLFHRFRPPIKLSLILGLILYVSIGLVGFAGTATSTILGSSPNPSAYGQDVTFMATVSPIPNGGTVTFKEGASTLGTDLVDTAGQATLTINYLALGNRTITAEYSGTGTYDASTSNSLTQVVKRASIVTVFCADTPLIVNTTATGTVTITGLPEGGPIPTGRVNLSHTGNGTLSPGHWILVTGDAGQFEFTYTPDDADGSPHMITASYVGDSEYVAGSDTFNQEIVKRAVDIQLSCSPVTAYVGQPVTITVNVEDDTTEGTAPDLNGMTVTLSTTSSTGWFGSGAPGATYDATLNSSGTCTVSYRPGAGEAGTTTITATYVESSVYASKSSTQQLTVELRPTETTVDCVDEDGDHEAMLVSETGTCTVTVKDASGVAIPSDWPDGPVGLVKITSSLETAGDGNIFPAEVTYPSVTPSGDKSELSFNYGCTSLVNDADYDTIGGIYTAVGGIYEDSAGGYAQPIYRRPTETTVTLTVTDTGYDAEVTVNEQSGLPGTVSAPYGDIIVKTADDDGNLVETEKCSNNFYNVIPCSFSGDTDEIIVNVAAFYEPDDEVHLKSAGSNYVTREDAPNLPSGGSAGSMPPDGAINIDAITLGLNSGVLAASTLALIFDAAALVADATPDPVVGVGVGIIVVAVTGVTIPTSDIIATIIGAARIALQTYTLIATTDLDGDGLPGIIELVTHTSDTKFDSDGDGLGDGYEVTVAGGFYGPHTDEADYAFGDTACPNPNIEDSDQEGIIDGDEGFYNTSMCDPDTDDDGLTDYQEVTTWSLPDIRDHADPLMMDTDGDGLRDAVEYYMNHSCPFVNDDDSDDDGLQDGYEDVNGDGCWGTHTGTVLPWTCVGGITVGDSTTQASRTITWWETNLCNPDTDGDGLLDGEEEGLFAAGEVTPKDVSTTVGVEGANLGVTVPALDSDMDNDGLSDYDEVNIYQTDPMDADTDDDTVSDYDEVATWAYADARDHSNPREDDTDGDGLTDDVEIAEGCPHVNDDDSDDDGLQDGTESWNGDGTITTGTIGDSSSQADTNPSGETDFCNPDTDGDGLTDGEEVALLGGLPVSPTTGFTPVIPQGVSTVFGVDGPDLGPTVPPLDDDCDNDGLSDYEEINITHTNPLDADSDNDTISDANELIATGGTWPNRTFIQVSDPLDPDTDDDDLHDYIEYPGSGLGTSRGLGGTPDNVCPYVNDDDSDDDGLQDGVEDANHDGTWGVAGTGITVGSFGTQASKTVDYWECDLCNPDTDGDGLLDGEEVALIGGGPILGRPRPVPGFYTVTPEGVSTVLPLGTSAVPSGYTHTAPSPGTGNNLIAPYIFIPVSGASIAVTIPALDVDSDNDGLSDYEEVNITMTDPLDQDSDNDTLMDSDELIATGGTVDIPGNPGTGPRRTFDQESNPLDINTDDDYLFDPQEYAGSGLSLLAGALGGVRDLVCPFVNDDDSDDDGIQDGAVITVAPAGVITSLGVQFTYTHYEDFIDVNVADVAHPGVMRTVPTHGDGEQQDDAFWNVCDADSDGDGLNDGEEIAIGTDPDDWDTDDDGRNDWHEVTGGGPIPTDPFDPDTDDDGLLDSAEVFGLNPTNPLNADTDGDGLCDGGTGTPWMTSGDARVVVNPICKSCNTPGLASCGTLTRGGSAAGIGDHPNPHGYGEDKNGNGAWDGTIGQLWQSGDPGTPETDPNQYDTDGDALADGIEVLGFSTSRQSWIPTTDLFGRTINVTYPACGCLEPLIADTDGDGLEDGYEDNNHDGNFDFLPSDFDYAPDPLPGPPQPNPNETNPCDPDTDDDDLTDYEERYQSQVFVRYPDLTRSFNPTNPLDHDTDNDWLLDGFEVKYVCVAVTYSQLDNDGDALIDEDPIDGLDNDGDGLIDEDPVDFFVRFVPMLDPTCRDSDSDGWIDGLDDDPCNSELIPLLPDVQIEPIDSDGDGFADNDEIMAGTHPHDPEDYPVAYCKLDLDFDQAIDDRMWLERRVCCGIANSVVIDIDSNVLIDARVQIVAPRDVKQGDFDGDGAEDDYRYVIEYAFSNYRVVQPRIVLTIYDYNGDLTIDHAEVVRK